MMIAVIFGFRHYSGIKHACSNKSLKWVGHEARMGEMGNE